MKKGFTLIELLGVITVLGIISLLVIPVIDMVIKNAKEDLYNKQKDLILTASKLWASEAENKVILEENTIWPYEITLGDLQDLGLIKQDVKNPLNDSTFSPNLIIQITKTGTYYEYQILDNTDPLAPTIALNGDRKVNTEVKTTYTELGAVAISKGGSSLTVTTTIKKSGVVVGGVDTSVLGTYRIMYSANDNGKTSSVIREVNIVDTTKPVLTCGACPGNNTITIESTSTYTLPTVTATDNSVTGNIPVTISGNFSSSIPGTKKMSYIATDSSGNSNSLVVTIIVNDTVAPTVTINQTVNSAANNILVELVASDSGSGLHEKAYSFDDGNTWQDIPNRNIVCGSIINIVVRDKSLNRKTTTFTATCP